MTDGHNTTVYLGDTTTPLATVDDLAKAIDLASGVNKALIAAGAAAISNSSGTDGAVAGGILTLTTGTCADLEITGKADLLKALGLSIAVGRGRYHGLQGEDDHLDHPRHPRSGRFDPEREWQDHHLQQRGSPGSCQRCHRLRRHRQSRHRWQRQFHRLSAGCDSCRYPECHRPCQRRPDSGEYRGAAVLTTATGIAASSVSASGTLKLSTGTTADLSITGTGNALAALGLTGASGTDTSFVAARTAGTGGINGKTLSFTSFNGGTAVDVTFGDGTGGTVKTLDQLNAKLQANNQTATIDLVGKLTISVANDYASSTLGSVASGGVIGGTATATLAFSTASAPVIDGAAQAVRGNLVRQYNDILAQITTTSQDASFNGVNLLGGDQLKLTFNETGRST